MARPNILWLMADELRADALGCYGGAWARVATPNIDALAARGCLFTNAWCNAPACVPSRLSMLTAAAPERTGVHSNEGAWASFPIPVRLTTFPEHFAAHGYRTATIGKSHHSPRYTPWSEENAEGGEMHDFGLDIDPAPMQPIVPDGIPSPVGGTFPADRPYPPDAVARNAIHWLDDHLAIRPGTPFLLRVSWLQPHTPVLPPEAVRALYRAGDWPGHALPRGHGSAYEEAFAEMAGGRRLTDAEMKQAQADYHALVTWLDMQVGLVLAMLRTRGLEKNTIIVLNSDHGASLGENGLLGKVVFAPQSQRVPLILVRPGRFAPGSRRDDPAANLDLARTLCDLAGLAPLDRFEGRSLASDPPPDAIFATIGTGAPGARASSAANRGTWPDGGSWPRRACIRAGRFRLDMNTRRDGVAIRPEDEDIFLADSIADPRELTNLAADPMHAATVAALRARLLAHVADGVEPDVIPAFSEAEAGRFLPPKIAGR